MAQTVNTKAQLPGIEQDNANKKYATSWLGGPLKDASNIWDWAFGTDSDKASDTSRKSGGVSGPMFGAGGKVNPYEKPVSFAYPH